jgi:mRNA-degrading endonuclease HigB of HigAB toxin-antitoxin module
MDASNSKTQLSSIKGNHYRLLTIIHYRYKRVYIQGFFTHAAYERWTRTHRQG